MKKTLIISLVLATLLFRGCSQIIMCEDERTALSISLEQVWFASDWLFNDSERFTSHNTDNMSRWTFDSMRLDLIDILSGNALNSERGVYENSIIYTSVLFVNSEEEAILLLSEVSENTLIVWPSEITKRTLEWFNLMAKSPVHVPEENRSSYPPFTRIDLPFRYTAGDFYHIMPDFGLAWPLTMEQLVTNFDSVLELWYYLNHIDRGVIIFRAQNNMPIPTLEEFLLRFEVEND